MPPKKREREVEGPPPSVGDVHAQQLRREFFGEPLKPTGSKERNVQLTTWKRLLPDELVVWLFKPLAIDGEGGYPVNHAKDVKDIWNLWMQVWSPSTDLPKATRNLLGAHKDDPGHTAIFPTIADSTDRLISHRQLLQRFVASLHPAIRATEVLGQAQLEPLSTTFPSWPSNSRFIYYMQTPYLKGGENYWDEVLVRLVHHFSQDKVSADLGPLFQYYLSPLSVKDVMARVLPDANVDVMEGVDRLRTHMRDAALPPSTTDGRLLTAVRYHACSYYGDMFDPYAGLDRKQVDLPYRHLVRHLSPPVLNSTVYLTLPGMFMPFQFTADGQNFYPIIPGWTTTSVLKLLGLEGSLGPQGIMALTWTFNPARVPNIGTAMRSIDHSLPLPSWSILDVPPHGDRGEAIRHQTRTLASHYGISFHGTVPGVDGVIGELEGPIE